METPQHFTLSYCVKVSSPRELARLVAEVAADTGMTLCSISHREAVVECFDDSDFEEIYSQLVSRK